MSPHDYADTQPGSVADAVTAIKLERQSSADVPAVNGRPVKDEHTNNGFKSLEGSKSSTTSLMNGMPSSAVKSRSQSRSPVKKDGDADAREDKVGGDITVKMEPGQPPKLSRSSSQKIIARPPQLFLDLPNSTAEARTTFETLEDCTYANKYMGYTEHAMECDCAEEWGKPSFISSFLYLFIYSLRPKNNYYLLYYFVCLLFSIFYFFFYVPPFSLTLV